MNSSERRGDLGSSVKARAVSRSAAVPEALSAAPL
jgi:hypothetical protein